MSINENEDYSSETEEIIEKIHSMKLDHDIEKMKLIELKDYCKKHNIVGVSRLKKAEIIEKIKNNKHGKLKFVDLFCGIGGFHVALKQLDCECVLACDIDKKCCETYLKNHGIQPVSDIKSIDEKTMPDFDILCGGFPCFVAGTKVLTHTGYKNIEDITLNDKLMTHSGKFQNIINLQRKNYTGNLYKIKIKYHALDITCTDEHPFYVREKVRSWNTKLNKYVTEFKPARWKPAKCLNNCDYYGMKINENNIVPEFSFDKKINQYKTVKEKILLDNPNMWFMMGYFLGDGWIEETKKYDGRSMDKIRFAINTNDRDYVCNILSSILSITDKKCPSGNNCNKYGCSDFVWFNIFKQFGKYAHGKLIPEWVQDAPKKYIQEFINGYHKADGCITKNDCYEFTTVSYNLALGLQRLYLKLGNIFSINKSVRLKTTVIEGRTVNQRDTYTVRGYTRETDRKQSSFIDNGYAWFAPFKIQKSVVENVSVYNFEVENDNSYIVENTIVHNCQPFSNGGKKQCFEDDRGLLFDEIMRIAKHKKPKFMFLENVKHILKVSNGEVFKYIVDKIKQHGYKLQVFQLSPHNYGIPQQRERVFFVCVREDIYNNSDIVLDTTKNILTPQDIVKEHDERYVIPNDIKNVLDAWNVLIKKFEKDEKISPTILIHDYFKNYSQEDFSKFPQWKKDYITKNKPLLDKYQPIVKEWYSQYKEVLSKREIYGQLEWQVGKIKENDNIYDYFIQIRQSGIRVKKPLYFPTLVAMSQIPIYGKTKSYISPRQCARLQSFPESFVLDNSDKVVYKQMGNSVNVFNVSTVIKSTLKHYNLLNTISNTDTIEQKSKPTNYDLNNILDKILESKTYSDISTEINVAIGTIKRWDDLKKVPNSYIFELLKLANINIDYSKFTYKEKDQFFTPDTTAKYCYSKFLQLLKKYKDNENYTFIEPSAGNGVFLKILPSNKRIGFDIEPRFNEIRKQDYLDWEPNENKKYVVIGNPPFGLRGQLALKFINHSSKFANYVCFILPQLFESDGKGVPRKRVVDLNLIHSEKLDTEFESPNGKNIKVQCIFQVWSKFHKNNNYDINKTENENIKIYSLSDGGTPSTTRNKKMFYKCDAYIPSTCFGKENMKYYDNFDNLPRKKGYGIVFVKNKEENLEKFKTIDWSNVAFLSTNSAYNIRSSQISDKFIE
jgi:DNA-cytosine methyltransferase